MAPRNCKNGTFDAHTITLADKDSCVLHPFNSSAATSFDAITSTPLVSDLIRLGAAGHPRICYRGWIPPGLGWEAWVRDMACDEKVIGVWRKAGIEDAILRSVTGIKPDRDLMEALCGFWCPATRTFVFPWGEATFTLEDAYVLGNLQISGSRLDRQLTDEEEEYRIRLYVEKEKIFELHPKAKATRRVTLDIWLQWFLELQGEEELKHLGFLTYWLAKNVVPPYPSGEVPRVIFGLAARLSCGDRIALAPFVTANLYHDLSKISTYVLNKPEKRRGKKIDFWAQFDLLQAWVWARFECLSPLTQGSRLFASESWFSHSSSGKNVTSYVESLRVFLDERNFTWRPYTRRSSGWKEPAWYDKETRIIHVEEGMPAWVYDYMAISYPSTLQGFYGDDLISSERYLPHRVARQFGYDQTVPLSNDSVATLIANKPNEVGHFVNIQKVSRCGKQSRDYREWWKNLRREYHKTLNEFAMPVLNFDGTNTMQTNVKHRGSINGFQERVARNKASYRRKHCQGKENKECSNLVVEPGGNQTRDFEEENGEAFIFAGSSNSVAKVDECGTSSSKSLGDGKDQHSKKRSSNLVVEPGGNQIRDFEEENGEAFIFAGSSNTVAKVDECGTSSSKSLGDGKDQQSKKRKLNVEDGSRTEETLFLPWKDIVVIDVDKNEVDSEEDDRRLVAELEEFRCNGLLNEWDPSSSDLENEESSRIFSNGDTRKNKDPYGREATRLYPQFFKLIPQKPHYKGLLHARVSENVRQDIYLSKWYRLVDLMRKTLQTTCHTDPKEIENLMREARKFEGFGFSVKHIIARLKEPQVRLRRLNEARAQLEEAKSREQHAIQMDILKREIDELECKLRASRKRLKESQQAMGVTPQECTTNLMNFRKEVENAESNLRAIEHDAEALRESIQV